MRAMASISTEHYGEPFRILNMIATLANDAHLHAAKSVSTPMIIGGLACRLNRRFALRLAYRSGLSWSGFLFGWGAVDRLQIDMRRIWVVIERRAGGCVHAHPNHAADQDVPGKPCCTAAANFCFDFHRPLFISVLFGEGGKFSSPLDINGARRAWTILPSRCADFSIIWRCCNGNVLCCSTRYRSAT